jgi:hypothetical protein
MAADRGGVVMGTRSSKGVRASLATALVVALSVLGPNSVGAAGVGVQVSCYTNPERTTITNNTSSSIRIRTIGSTYRPQDFEPIRVARNLAPGKSLTFQSGFRATKNVLTNNFIYSNLAERDATRVVTSVGSFVRKC